MTRKAKSPDAPPAGIPAQVFQQAVEQADVAVSITDTRANILYVNPAFARVTGYGPQEAVGCNESMLSHKTTPPAVYRELWARLTEGESWSGRLVNRRRDGGRYLAEIVITPVLDERGVASHYLGVHRDVTELHRLEAEVKNQKALIESVVDAAPVALALLDDAGRVVLDNHEYKKLMADLKLAEPALAMLDAVRADLGREFGAPVAGGHAFLNQEVRIDAPAGRSTRWFSCSGIWVNNGDGSAGGFFERQDRTFLLLVASEVTEQRAQQEKMRMAALQAMLAEEDRAGSLRETLSAAVFQLEGPINVMNSVLATIARRGCCEPAGAALAEALRAAQAAVDTMRSAIPEHSAELPTAVNMNEALKDVIALETGRLLAAGISVGWRPQAVLPAIHGYPNRLRTMLKAIVDNAVEAMNGRGWRERELTLATRSVDGSVEVVIEDSGPGIAPELRLRVFEPFFTTKKAAGRHAGTGLASAQQVAVDHGGAIEIDPAAAGGCRVRVVLPLRANGERT